MVHVGFDDTDSRDGYCTTYLMLRFLGIIGKENIADLIGYPRLVRLNPTVPWKTRGNAALCATFGSGDGEKKVVGTILGTDIFSYPRSQNADDEKTTASRMSELFSRGCDLIEREGELGGDGTNPGIVVTSQRPDRSLYEKAVTSIVDGKEIESMLEHSGALHKGYKNKRGLIGASAAIAWTPVDKTFEIIAYRHREKWGTKREVDYDSVAKMDEKYPSTFNNVEQKKRHVCISPATPCPILFGIRGDKPDILPDASGEIDAGEEMAGSVIFMTNQGTDDHILDYTVNRAGAKLEKYHSYRLAGVVKSRAIALKGGHHVFGLGLGTRTGQNDAKIDCAAYEHSGEITRVARELIEGDEVTVCGSIRVDRQTLNIEKLYVTKLAEQISKEGNPKCPKCGKNMGHMGRTGGYRCKVCKAKLPETGASVTKIGRKLKIGAYEPPPSSRRHLSKPLKRETGK